MTPKPAAFHPFLVTLARRDWHRRQHRSGGVSIQMRHNDDLLRRFAFMAAITVLPVTLCQLLRLSRAVKYTDY